MKKTINSIFILVVLSLSLSCSDENNDSNTQTLVGVWKISKIAYSCSSETEQNLTLSNCQKDTTLSILENGSVILNDFLVRENGQCAAEEINGTWKIVDNKLIINYENSEDPTYTDFSNNSLSIGFYSTDPTKVCNDNSEVNYSYIKFVRQ